MGPLCQNLIFLVEIARYYDWVPSRRGGLWADRSDIIVYLDQ